MKLKPSRYKWAADKIFALKKSPYPSHSELPFYLSPHFDLSSMCFSATGKLTFLHRKFFDRHTHTQFWSHRNFPKQTFKQHHMHLSRHRHASICVPTSLAIYLLSLQWAEHLFIHPSQCPIKSPFISVIYHIYNSSVTHTFICSATLQALACKRTLICTQ